MDEIFGWSSLILSLFSAGLLLWSIRTWPRGERCYCRGPRSGALGLFVPLRWFIRGRCWYDLRAQVGSPEGIVRCPECGSEQTSARMLRGGRRIRWWLVTVCVFLLAIGAFSTPWVRSGRWTNAVPTLALVVTAPLDAEPADNLLRAELDERIFAGKVSGLAAEIASDRLLTDLLDDDRRWNATFAARALEQMWPDSREALELAVAAEDRQSRLFAASILRRLSEAPSDALLDATILDLSDSGDEGLRWYLTLGNAQQAAAYLVIWAHEAEPKLADAMHSDDWQQRLLAAAVAGNARLTGLMEQAVPILIEHSRDNAIPSDAKVAAPALFRFGPGVIPRLRPYTTDEDDQLRGIVLAIIERLEHPERPLDQLEHPLPRITGLTHDPLANMPLERAAKYIW